MPLDFNCKKFYREAANGCNVFSRLWEKVLPFYASLDFYSTAGLSQNYALMNFYCFYPMHLFPFCSQFAVIFEDRRTGFLLHNRDTDWNSGRLEGQRNTATCLILRYHYLLWLITNYARSRRSFYFRKIPPYVARYDILSLVASIVHTSANEILIMEFFLSRFEYFYIIQHALHLWHSVSTGGHTHGHTPVCAVFLYVVLFLVLSTDDTLVNEIFITKSFIPFWIFLRYIIHLLAIVQRYTCDAI